MNEGAKVANGFIFVFLRTDTKLPDDADTQVMYGRARDTSVWGRFDLRYAGRHMLLPLFARLVELALGDAGIATGDQAIFVQREAFFRIDGFADIPFMEDVEISKRLKRHLAADLRDLARHRAGPAFRRGRLLEDRPRHVDAAAALSLRRRSRRTCATL